ncbi:hypothetical protein GOV03_02630 [Candidatus Woesearchaeota archaeon]|nr:hypothetical protein [Candidatus Woesearchaeota archaeon]
MFGFLKKLFQKEEEVFEVEEVRVEDFNSWLDNKIYKIDFKEEISGFFNQIKDIKWVLGEKITSLETAEMDEKEKERVDEKIKNVVLGHKENYTREMKRFLECLNIPEGDDLRKSMNFNEALSNSLDELSKKTAKSYQAAQHLFFKPVEEVFKAVGEINLLAKDFDGKLEKKGLKKINEIQEKVRFLQEDKRRRERLEEDLRWKEQKLTRCAEGKEKEEAEIDRLRNNDEYQELVELREEEEQINAEVEENKDEAFLFFSKIGRALRKYEKVTLAVEVVRDYLEDAVKALLKDKELKIVGVLEGLKKGVENGEVELDDKQKEIIAELVIKAKSGYLQGLVKKAEELQKKVNEIKTKLKGYGIDKLIEEAEYKSEHFEEQTVLMIREIEELKVKLQALGGEKLAEELKEPVKEMLKVEVRLV